MFGPLSEKFKATSFEKVVEKISFKTTVYPIAF